MSTSIHRQPYITISIRCQNYSTKNGYHIFRSKEKNNTIYSCNIEWWHDVLVDGEKQDGNEIFCYMQSYECGNNSTKESGHTTVSGVIRSTIHHIGLTNIPLHFPSLVAQWNDEKWCTQIRWFEKTSWTMSFRIIPLTLWVNPWCNC